MKLFLSLALLAAAALQAQSPQIPGTYASVLVPTNGGAVSWSVNNLISYAQLNLATGYFNVRTITPTGTGDTCLTCSGPESWSKGAPVWSADGNFIIFQAQMLSLGNTNGTGSYCNGKSATGTAPNNDGPAFPGEGSWNELWATNATGTTFWQLTNQLPGAGQYVACGGVYVSGGGTCTINGAEAVTYNGSNGQTTNAAGTILVSGGAPTGAITLTAGGSFYTSVPTTVSVNGCPSPVTITAAVLGDKGGVIYPTISWDGTKLAWGQRLINNEPGTQAAQNTSVWEIAIGNFSDSGGIPTLTNIQYYSPGTGAFPYVEPRSWSADNSTVFFMGSLSGEPGSVKNIYSFNPATQTLLNLTKSNSNWNEYPVALPPSWGSNKIIYMLYPLVGPINPWCIGDWWVMNYDGTDNYQLTFYNTPGFAYYFPPQSGSPNTMPGGSCIDTHSWSPDGTKLVAYNNLFAAGGNGQSGNPQGPIWIFNIADVGAVNRVSSSAYPNVTLSSRVVMQ
jgi:hypothetical protein